MLHGMFGNAREVTGNPTPIHREFKRASDIVSVQKTLADHILV